MGSFLALVMGLASFSNLGSMVEQSWHPRGLMETFQIDTSAWAQEISTDEKVTVSGLEFAVQMSSELLQGSIDELTPIKATLTNNENEKLDFVLIVLVKDMNGNTVDLFWTNESLMQKQSIDISRPWMPEQSGQYTVNIFVWDGIDSPTPLSYRVGELNLEVAVETMIKHDMETMQIPTDIGFFSDSTSNSNERKFMIVWMLAFSQTTEMMDVIKKYGRDGDVILARVVPLDGPCPPNDKIKSTKDMFPNMEIAVLFNSIADIKRCGGSIGATDYLGLDYEPSSATEKHDPSYTTNQQLTIIHFDEARSVASSFGKKFMVTPPYIAPDRIGVRQGNWNYGEIAKHTDLLDIQMQGFMSKPATYLKNAKSVNTQVNGVDVILIMQTSLTRGTVDQNIQVIKGLQQLQNIDGVLIFHKAWHINDLTRIVDTIR